MPLPRDRLPWEGLGLNISTTFVEMFGGKLQVESEVGHGSLFYFTLPVTVDTCPKQELTNEQAAQRFSGHVLVADDAEFNQLLMEEYLQSLGLSYEIAEDGAKAVELFRNNHYDLVLMDEQMPNMDGLEATRKIRELETANARKRTPVVAFSGSVGDEPQRFSEAGMDAILEKPIQREQFLGILQRFL